tara:strand:+ start:2359 stop:4185 length:1827 start_codon:yes stop_codon:yes gene_type:complete
MTKPEDLLKESTFCKQNISRELGLNIHSKTHFKEHRSGWNYVNECISDINNENGYLFIDFIEKLWGWNAIDLTGNKGIFFENKSYHVDNSEIKNINNMEYVYLHDVGVIYWNGEDWMKSELITKENVELSPSYGVIDEYWVGVFHNPVNIPQWFDYSNSPQVIVKRPDFQKSLEMCRGIYVFSEYLKTELLKLGGWPCPINVIKHPTERINTKWCPNLHSNKLVQVGYWLRKISSIWEVDVSCNNYDKYWVNRAPYGWECFNRQVYHENKTRCVAENNVNLLQLSNEEYDKLFQHCVLFLDLYDSSVNNSVLEAIIRHTPLVINRIQPIIEILGDDYPLYFDNLSEVSAILTKENIMKAHLHMKQLEESDFFYKGYFINDITSQSILQKKTKYDGPVISMGVDCLPRAMCCKFNFKPNKSLGGMTMPFDLAWHDYPQICELLETDFKDYLDPTQLFLNENLYIQHRKYGTLFNHESDTSEKALHFMRNNCEEFVKRYQTRIDNLYCTINSNESLVFVLHYNKHPIELVEIIKRKWPLKKFVVLTLNTPYFHESHQDQPNNVEIANNNFLFFTIRYPKQNYVWYRDQSETWERKIQNILKTYLNEIPKD